MSGIINSFALLLSQGRSQPVPANAFPYLRIVNGNIFGITNMWIIAFILAFGFYILLKKTVLGRSIYTVGSAERVAWMSGIYIARSKVVAFILSGFSAGAMGIMLACKLFGGSPILGSFYILQSVAVVIVGGVAITGGVGGVANTLMGALTLGILRNGMTVVGIDIYAQQIILGIMIILALAVTFDRSKVAVVK
jgi:ribose transport system permease protein